ncbi:MAG TPA: TadE/TadG family type IV pilus assembly protein [Rhizomicrobium sp.]|nr:TadE/TadG family type IV pilus assembly protein [Rhizomicrobium sp.]
MNYNDMRKMLKDERGAAAVEFAIVGPVYIILTIGILYTCLVLFSVASMQYAVEQAARCAGVNSTACATSGQIVAYAKADYLGPFTPTFTYAAKTCGNQVSASASLTYDVVFKTFTIPFSVKACFP